MCSTRNTIFTKHTGIRHIRFVRFSVTCNFTDGFLKIVCAIVVTVAHIRRHWNAFLAYILYAKQGKTFV